MSSERFWIVVLAVTTFLAGVAGGRLLGLEERSVASGRFAAYEARLAEEYGLSSLQQARLRRLLEEYDAERERLIARQLQSFDAEFVKAGRDCLDRIEGWVIPPGRRAEFRADAGLDPRPGTPPVSPR